MSDYVAPLKDMQFVLKELAGLDQVAKLPGCEDASAELVDQILEESGKFCAEVLAPLNQSGDEEGSKWDNGRVTTPKGFIQAYKQFVEGGWNALQFPPEFGGQGLPKLVATPVMEMWKAANLSFSLCPLLTGGAIEALLLRGADALKKTYLPKMVEGTWTGTMNLTESQAGSDLALVKAKAVRHSDERLGEHYRIYGQKIFITYGEHVLAENIVHLVLARTPDAPEGVKGISLFIVPKFLVKPDGSLGERNDVHCVSIEHKLGIKASPTAVLQFGDHGGAVGMLVGEENRGLEYMFIMMNAARFGVGMQGIGVAERAYQKAVQYARDRVQSRDLAGSAGPVAIIHHPDVRRMLMSMRAQTEGARSLAYVAAALSDIAHHHADAETRKANQAVYEYLVPIVKGWSTEMSLDVTSTGVQVHGGMGFIEETGAAQHYRDAKILTIYEGTTAIQANDLVGRKTVRDGGATAKALIAQVRAVEAELAAAGTPDLLAIQAQLTLGSAALEEVVNYILANIKQDIKAVFAGSVVYLKLAGIVLGGWQMARAALIAHKKLQAGEGDAAFYQAKIVTARFFADHILSAAQGLSSAIVNGSAGVLGLPVDQF